MRECVQKCVELDVACPIEECRNWIEYEEDNNCTLVAVKKNGKMTLREVADRVGLSFVRIKQIEDKAKSTLYKRILNQ